MPTSSGSTGDCITACLEISNADLVRFERLGNRALTRLDAERRFERRMSAEGIRASLSRPRLAERLPARLCPGIIQACAPGTRQERF